MSATPPTCARAGCTRWAKLDEYCSSYCAKVACGVIPGPDPNVHRSTYWRRKARLAEREPVVVVENPDAMARVVPGSYGTGKRQ